MKKYLALFRYELKTILSDAMNLFFLIYPFFMLAITGWLVPVLLARTGVDASTPGYGLQLLGVFTVVLAIGGFIMGALLGFSLLENKDEQTIKSIAVSPVSVQGYALFKTLYAYGFGVLGNLVMVGGLKLLASDLYSFVVNDQLSFGLDAVSYIDILLFSIVSALIVPSIGGVFAALAKNKIEGFTLMKSSGILFIIPVLAIFDVFADGKQYLLGFAPNFWPTKAFLTLALSQGHNADLPYLGYLLMGSLYMIVLGYISLRYFIKRSGAERT